MPSTSPRISEDIPLPTLNIPKDYDYAISRDDLKENDKLPPSRDDVVNIQSVHSAQEHESDSSDSSATVSSDEFDWDAGDDASTNRGQSTKAKRGHAIYRAFMKLSRPIRTILVGAIGVGILITPLLVFSLRFNSSPARVQAHVWSLWLTITWATGCITFLVVDAIPRIAMGFIRLIGYKAERLQTTIELTTAVSGWLKLALDIAWMWIALSAIRGSYKPPGSYWTVVNRVIQALFSASLFLLVEKVFLRYVAINFHRKALAERLAENKLGLAALDRLSNAQPTPSSKRNPYRKRGHKSMTSSLDMLGFGGRGGAAQAQDSQASSSRSSPTYDNGIEKTTSPTGENGKKVKLGNAERRKRRKHAVATVIVDGLGGAIGQVALKNSSFNRGYGSLDSASKLARKLFSTLSDVHPPRSYLLVDDFLPYFNSQGEAHAAFDLFDKDGNGKMTKREMREAVRRIYRERKDLIASLKDVGSAVAKLDAVMIGLALIIFIFVCLLIFNRSNTITSLVPLATIILGFSFVFGHSAQTLFESLIFIFSTHVFDVGDLVMIDDSPMFVREFGLFSTTFQRVDGQMVIAPNSLLASSKLVHNLRRSNSMWEDTKLMVAYDTPLEIIEQLRIRLVGYVNEYSHEWSNVAVNIEKMEYQNAIFLIVAMEHRPNWQDWGGRWGRRTAFMRHLKTILEDLDVKYTMPIQPVLLPRERPQLLSPMMGPNGSGSPRLRQPPEPRGLRTRSSRETLGKAPSVRGSGKPSYEHTPTRSQFTRQEDTGDYGGGF